jgi:rubrerythrin
MRTDPDYLPGSLFICRDCGTGVENAAQEDNCPECGGPMRDVTVAHD